MKLLLTLVLLLVLLAGIAVGVAYSGLVNVSATGASPAPVDWFLRTTSEASIERRAEKIAVPPLDDPSMIATGVAHYQEMCVGCHGAPGEPRSEIGEGLNPSPPDLKRRSRLSPEEAAESFWIIKNGIRMTGMPAFGPTHDDAKIWAIVAFLNRLPELSADDYATLVRQAQASGDEDEDHDHDHDHGPEAPAAGTGGEAHHPGSAGVDFGRHAPR